MDLMTGPAWRWLSILYKVIGTLAMEFNDHEELVKIKFHKINDLIPFSNQYDCEMNPDYIDGGHGIQVSQFTKSVVDFHKDFFRTRDFFLIIINSSFYSMVVANSILNSSHAQENPNEASIWLT